MTVGRKPQETLMKEFLSLDKSSFFAVIVRRRVGKTFLIDAVYRKHYCLSVTGKTRITKKDIQYT